MSAGAWSIKRLLGGRVVAVAKRFQPYELRYLTKRFALSLFSKQPGFFLVTRRGLFLSIHWTAPLPDRGNRDPWLQVLGVRS